MASPGKLRQVKVVMLGDSGVGKSSIMLRFVTGDFSEHSEPTLGGAFMAKLFNHEGTSIKYQSSSEIWDTAGQEKYHSLAPMYYRDAQVAVLIYDITKNDSFTSLKKWVDELKENGPKDLMFCVVGNKIDLDNEEVSFDEAQKFAKDLGAIMRLTSAKEDRGINELFGEISKEVMKREQKATEQQNIQITTQQPKKKEKSCC